MSVRPKKHLGQHFLWDKNIAQKIVEAFKAAPTQKVLEIGPGKGVLSQYLLSHFGSKFYAVEIDAESSRYLLKEYPELENMECDENLPLTNCDENSIILSSYQGTPKQNKIIQEDNCIIILANPEDMSKVTDEFVLKTIGVK